MDAVAVVLKRRQNGEKIALCRDPYGNHWAELKSGWLIAKRDRVELTFEEYVRVGQVMSAAARSRSGDGAPRAQRHAN